MTTDDFIVNKEKHMAHQETSGSAGTLSEPRVGTRLRHARILLGMSLREVAQRANVTEGYVSKVENDKVLPSLATLHRIANALETNISALLAMPENTGKIVSVIKADKRPIMRFDKPDNGDGVILERLSPVRPDSLLQSNIHVVEAGGGSGEPISHRGQEMGMVLEGVLDLFVGDETHRLDAGDSFSFNSEHEHYYRNASNGTTRVLWVNTPPTF